MSASSSDISPYTWQLWLLVLLPLVPALAMTLIDPTTIFLSAFDPLVAYSDPAYVVAIVGSWVVFFATIFLAFADVRSLKRRGLESPFHPAFILLGALIYVIGRSVVVKRETGAGLTPIWATLGVWLASGAASMIMAFNATGFLGF
ncbi:hypothetical protein A20C1_04826 [marine actinobacterium PHSC20C1]|nr:hypothetical protein A20C1_04826 [marine actinobacterium PHSC20C1]